MDVLVKDDVTLEDLLEKFEQIFQTVLPASLTVHNDGTVELILDMDPRPVSAIGRVTEGALITYLEGIFCGVMFYQQVNCEFCAMPANVPIAH